MDSIRITQLPTKNAAGTDDYIAVDSTANGTKKIQFPNLLDNGLTIQNKAADAKATGDAISEVNGAIGNEASTRQSADANLQTQIDQLIAPSGEAPSAAEIENARIGALPESTVYPTLGDAIRGQVSDLKSDFNVYQEDFVGLVNPIDSASLTSGYRIGDDGSLVSSANYSYTSLIQVESGKVYTFVFQAGDGYNTFWIHGYDENGDFVRKVDQFSDTRINQVASKDIVIPDDVSSIRISVWYKYKLVALYTGNTLNASVSDMRATLGSIEYDLNDLVNEGSYIGENGTIVDTTLDFARSNMFPAFNISEVLVVRSPRISGGLAVAFYSANEFSASAFISGYQYNDISRNVVLTPPDGTKYIAFSSRTDEGDFSVKLSFRDLIDVIQDNAYKINNIEGFPFKGKKLSILGDSISTYNGYIPSGNATFYPQTFMNSVSNTWWKKLLDATKMELLINNSYSGSHLSGSSPDSGLSRCTNLDDGVDTPDVVIVYMGVNDFNDSNVGIGECGLNPDTYSVNNFSDAYYTTLLNISEAYPNARLYVATIMEYALDISFPNKRGARYLHQFNDAIYKVASIFGAKVIDFNACGVNYHNESTTLGDTLHPNVIGHNLMFEEAYKHFK